MLRLNSSEGRKAMNNRSLQPGNKIFWDVADMKNCVIVDLKDEEYKQLIIEVDNTAEAIKNLTS